MKFEAGKTYALRIGTTAVVVAVDGDPRWPITARHDDGARCWHTPEGRFDEHGESSWDLMLPALEGRQP